MEGMMLMNLKPTPTIEKRKRCLYYQLIIIENYQKAINKELGQLVEWVRLNIQDIAITTEEDFCKNYEDVHDQLSQLLRSSKELYTMLQATKAGMLTNESQTPAEKLVSIGVRASGSKSYVDGLPPANFLTGIINISTCVGEESGSSTPKLDISKINTSRVSGLYCEDITSESELHKLQKKEVLLKHSSGSYPFTNSQSSAADQSPEEVVSSNVYNELIVTKIEERLAAENSNCTSLRLRKEDPHIFTNKSKSSNDNQTYIVQSEWEVWDTFEFTALDNNTSDYVKPEEERTSNIQVVVSTLDATSPQEPLRLNDTLRQPNPIEQVSTSQNCIFSPRQYFSPNSMLGPLAKSQFPDSPVERDMEQHVASNILEFQFCRWQEMEIRVSYAIDPHYFYIQHSGQELPELMRELNIECSMSTATMCYIPLISSYVCAWFPESKQWYRARVIRIVECEATITDDNHQHILVEVLCVDYGFSASLPVSCLKSLTPTCCVLPQQALRVSLENVSPIHGATWSTSESNWFKKFVKNKTFFARLYQRLSIMTVALFSERGKIGIMRRGSQLSQRMAAAGLAKFSDGSCVSPKVGASIPLYWKQRLVKLLSEPTNWRK